ncbi:MAG: hypothetical protein EBZ47_06940, partial [Chlamydiae bacterium]|nr:hypothetical protein [Chlamydiota bacterium]
AFSSEQKHQDHPNSIQKNISTAKQNSMSIEPKHRAADYKEAFECLRKEKAQSKVFVKLIDGSLITNIIDMNLMPSNTVFLLRFNTPKGIKLQAIELEMIQGIGYLE